VTANRFADRLRVEAQGWVRDGLVTPEQAARIVERYPATPRWWWRPATIFSVLGGALIAAAVALLVAHNWPALPRWSKLTGLIALLVAAYAAGFALRERGRPRTGEGLFVVGGGLFLVGIALVGQLYNLHGRPADALLLWWALLMPAGYVLPSIALLILAWGGVAAWYAALLTDHTSWLGRDVAGLGFGLTTVAAAAGGILAWALGTLHGDGAHRRVRQALEQLAFATIAATSIILSLGLGSPPWVRPEPARPFAVIGVVVTAAVAICAAARRLPDAHAAARAGLIAAWLVQVAYLLAVVTGYAFGQPRAVMRALTYTEWALFFAFGLVLILYGARWNRPAWINWGVVFVGLNAVVRYVELFGTMLETSALFFVTGVFVLALGWGLERFRRGVTARASASASPA
jgi:uncharacterized membrane protein